MKKLIVLLFIFILILPCCGCGTSAQAPLSQVESDLLAISQNLNGMEKGDSKALKRYYGLNLNDFEEVLIYIPASYLDVSELLVIKVKDAAQLDLVEEAVDTRNAMQQESFGGYGPEQVALLNDYEFKIVGNTLFYCVSPESSTLKDAFIKSIKTNQ